MTFTVAGYFLPAPLARFRRLFPGVEPVLHELDRADIEQGLVDGRIDLALFLVSNLRNAAAIDTEVLIQSKRRLWLPVNHALLQPKRVSLGDVAPEPYIMLTIDEADQTAMRYWEGHALPPQCRLPHLIGGGGAQHGGDRCGRLHPLRHGLPTLVAGGRPRVRGVRTIRAVPTMDVGRAAAWQPGSKLIPRHGLPHFCHNTYNASGGELA